MNGREPGLGGLGQRQRSGDEPEFSGGVGVWRRLYEMEVPGGGLVNSLWWLVDQMYRGGKERLPLLQANGLVDKHRAELVLNAVPGEVWSGLKDLSVPQERDSWNGPDWREGAAVVGQEIAGRLRVGESQHFARAGYAAYTFWVGDLRGILENDTTMSSDYLEMKVRARQMTSSTVPWEERERIFSVVRGMWPGLKVVYKSQNAYGAEMKLWWAQHAYVGDTPTVARFDTENGWRVG